MADRQERAGLEQVAQRIYPGGSLVEVRALKGGISAQVDLLVVEMPVSNRRHVVVRQYGDNDRAQNPSIAADEYKLLSMLKQTGLPVPQPYLFDSTCTILPVPYIAIEYLAGEVDHDLRSNNRIA